MSKNPRILRDLALDVYGELYDLLSRHVLRTEMAGSLRRHQSTVGDVDVVVVPGPSLKPIMRGLGYSVGEQTIKGKFFNGTKVEIYLASTKSWGACLLYATGSKQFNIEMRAVAKRKGYTLNRHGLWCHHVRVTDYSDETNIFELLGLTYLKPIDRDSLSGGGDVLFRKNVQSHSYWNVHYLVTFNKKKGWSCSCPDFIYRRAGTGQFCKHIRQVNEETKELVT